MRTSSSPARLWSDNSPCPKSLSPSNSPCYRYMESVAGHLLSKLLSHPPLDFPLPLHSFPLPRLPSNMFSSPSSSSSSSSSSSFLLCLSLVLVTEGSGFVSGCVLSTTQKSNAGVWLQECCSLLLLSLHSELSVSVALLLFFESVSESKDFHHFFIVNKVYNSDTLNTLPSSAGACSPIQND